MTAEFGQYYTLSIAYNPTRGVFTTVFNGHEELAPYIIPLQDIDFANITVTGKLNINFMGFTLGGKTLYDLLAGFT